MRYSHEVGPMSRGSRVGKNGYDAVVPTTRPALRPRHLRRETTAPMVRFDAVVELLGRVTDS